MSWWGRRPRRDAPMPADPDGIVALVHVFEQSVSAERLRADVETLAVRPRSRRHAPQAMRQAEAYAAAELRAAGWSAESRPFDLAWRLSSTDRHHGKAPLVKIRLSRRLTGANLVARLPGADEQRPAVVLCAHLDTVDASPGADDNASGVAAVLETARLLAALPDPPAVTLLLTDLEELGLIGARVAARELGGARRISGVISLEAVGYFAAQPDSQRLPAGFGLLFPAATAAVRATQYRGDFAAVVHRGSSAPAAAVWKHAAAGTDPGLRGILLRDPRPDGLLGQLIGLAIPPMGHLDRSDHSPFWNRRIPALMVTGTANFRNPHYHRPSDEPGIVDYRGLTAVTVATAVTAVRWPC